MKKNSKYYYTIVALPVSDIAARSSLRSAERGDLFVPRTRTMKLSRRSFTVAAPVVWNSLPAHLRSPLISRGQFRAGLKTHLFKQAYSLLRTFCFKSVTNWTVVSEQKLHKQFDWTTIEVCTRVIYNRCIFINNFLINKKLMITLTASDAGDNESSGIVILAQNWTYHSCSWRRRFMHFLFCKTIVLTYNVC